jgi:hypothetical protein
MDYVAMNEWTYINENKLKHESGFSLELVAGTWLSPSELNPVTVGGHSPVITAGLIRECLNYAKRQNPPKIIHRVSKPSSLVA